MSPETLEAIRALAQFAGGALIGFLVSMLTTYVNTRVRLMEAVLTEAEKQEPTPTRRAWWKTDRVLPYVVVIVMVALLLSGVSWIKSGAEEAENRRRDCIRSAETARVLQDRTRNYREAAQSERELWHNLRKQLRAMGAGPRSPLVQSIDGYLDDQQVYLQHLRENPYPRESVKDC